MKSAGKNQWVDRRPPTKPPRKSSVKRDVSAPAPPTGIMAPPPPPPQSQLGALAPPPSKVRTLAPPPPARIGSKSSISSKVEEKVDARDMTSRNAESNVCGSNQSLHAKGSHFTGGVITNTVSGPNTSGEEYVYAVPCDVKIKSKPKTDKKTKVSTISQPQTVKAHGKKLPKSLQPIAIQCQSKPGLKRPAPPVPHKPPGQTPIVSDTPVPPTPSCHTPKPMVVKTPAGTFLVTRLASPLAEVVDPGQLEDTTITHLQLTPGSSSRCTQV